MKAFLLMTFFLFPTLAFSQDRGVSTGSFIRIYDSNGDKIAKGRILSVTDSSLIVESAKKSKSIPIKNVAIIKTKHSFGHLPLVLGTSGIILGGIVGAASYQGSNNSGSGWDIDLGIGASVLGGSMIFGPGLALEGVLISATKKHETFEIDGDVNKLKKAVLKIEKMEDSEVNFNKEGTTKNPFRSLGESY